MRLTTRSEYALLALICIARRQKDGPVRAEAIREEYGLSKKYLDHLLSMLKQNRYVRARRGAGGGYTLARLPEQITLAEVIRLMDGALAPTEAVSKYFFAHTLLEQEKALLAVFKEIRDMIAQRLESLTLKDVL